MESRIADPSEGQGITVADLVLMFEGSEEASYEARKLAEKDRDYHDNKQLSGDEMKALKKRGQPPYIDNRIKSKIDYLVGLEKQQRINPRALPRTPMHEEDADSASQALVYVADKEEFDYKRSAVWRNLLIEGAGGISVAVESGYDGEPEIKLFRIPWDRMFWDPHSAEVDFSDATYLGIVQWMDYDDALRRYPNGQDALDVTMASVQASDTYDDKPKYNLWADKKRRRVRIVEIWIKRGDDWHFAEFTKGGILKAGPSPYKDDKGRSDCGMFFQSAYVDRDNNRYGLVRELILLQDAINKRNSKALHLLNTAQIVVRKGMFPDVEKLRREAARPDGVIEVPATGKSLKDDFDFNTRTDLAQAQFLLLQEAKNSIDLKGPNATAMGDKAQGAATASGKAIIASQQGGMVSLGDLLDNLRHLDKRIFRAIWNRIRQFWTAEKWVRVTDDEQNTKWVGVNVDPTRAQMLAQDPRASKMISGMVGSIAELDCDIIIDEAPDSVTPALEQWQALVELAKAGVGIPPDVLISAAPNLKNKRKLLERMKEPNPAQEAAQQLQLAGAKAEVEETQASALLKKAQAMKAGADSQQQPDGTAGKNELDWNKAQLAALTSIEVAKIGAGTDIDSQALAQDFEAALHLSTQAHEREMALIDAQQRAADRQSREKQIQSRPHQAA